MRIRKTEDEFQIHVAYSAYNKKGFEWEEVCCETNFKNAKKIKKDYLLNDKNLIDIKIIKKRVKKQEFSK